ncbi:MAG: DUF3168 domain-containing protein [Mycobacteriaceae bacterium]|nr:DUF3168 domain-containing protein [Mycobacteriaceae bacterium]
MSGGAVDVAIVTALASDSQLTTLAPGGVFRGTAPQGVNQPFVIVDLVTHADALQMANSNAYESALYMVKAVHASTSGVAAQAAADRIHALLNQATLTATGYDWMSCVREERVAYTEVDDASDRRYQHRGGMYRVMVDPQ